MSDDNNTIDVRELAALRRMRDLDPGLYARATSEVEAMILRQQNEALHAKIEQLEAEQKGNEDA
jgi:hypothetical protein